MSSITFQEQAGTIALEQYEWTRVWFEDTYDTTARRIAYIGDSISEGTHCQATRLSNRKILFNNFATSKAVDNPNYYPAISMFLKENPKLDAILINNGLHGFHLTEDAYKIHYQTVIRQLKADFPDTPIYLLLTTAISPTLETCPRVSVRNEMVLQIAREEKLSVIDLYTVTVHMPELKTHDGVHYTEEGYCAIARKILSELKL